MIIAQWVLVLLLLAIPTYVRDALRLPLFAQRILLVDFYAAFFGLLLCVLLLRRAAASHPPRDDRHPEAGLVQGLVFFAALFLVVCMLHGDRVFFSPLQVLNFALAAGILLALATRGQIPALLDRIGIALNLLILWQLALLAISFVAPLSGEINANRNLWPYIAVLVFGLKRYLGEPGTGAALMRALALAALNSTRAAFLLLAVVIVVDLLARRARSPALNVSLALLMVAGAVTTLYGMYSIGLESLMLGSIAELEHLGSSNIAAVDNNMASAISRVFSVPYTLDAVMQRDAVFGLGETQAAALTFWGYPVHNLFVSYIAIFGVIGVVFGALYLFTGLRVARVAPSVFAIALFVPCVANDLYLALTLCLVPLLLAVPVTRSEPVIAGGAPDPST
jgi:hypothetical protein